MKPKTIEIAITSFSRKGNGVGTYQLPNDQAIKVEVPFSAVGDTIQTTISRGKHGVYSGKLEHLVTSSPLRVVPKCLHFGICGGCRFQHIPYLEQLSFKEKFIHKCFAALIHSDVRLFPIEGSPQRWNYRNKMEFSFSSDKAGKKYLGLMMESGRGKVFNLTECHLTHHWFVDAVAAVRRWWHEEGLDAYHPHQDRGALRTLTLREGQRTGDRMIILTVSGNPDYALNKKQLETFVAFLRETLETPDSERHLSIFLKIQQIKKGSPTNFYEMLLHGEDHIRELLHIHKAKGNRTQALKFNISPSAFFQPNSLQAEKIYSHAVNMIDFNSSQTVYDLYCGTGALAMSVADQVKRVIGIEISPEAILDARQNAQQNGFENITFFAGDVQKVLQIPELPKPDVVMVDPPRAGLDSNTLNHLVSLNPEKILYVSCNPATQAANCAELLQKGYCLEAIQPIDQFPQTYHVENIVVLRRKTGLVA